MWDILPKTAIIMLNGGTNQLPALIPAPPVSQILSLLTEKEVMSVVATQAIIPRTFVLKPSMSLFIGGLARIDFLQVV